MAFIQQASYEFSHDRSIAALQTMKAGISALLLICVAACGNDDPLARLETGERGRVVRVIDGDALVLDTGQSVRLIGIEAPARAYRERPGQAYNEEAKRMLEDMALGREVQLRYGGLTRDRYDRALAHVVTDDALGKSLWLNLEMVQRGGARVRVYPDTAGGNGPIAAAEADARQSKRGLWSKRAYRIPNATDLPENFYRFQIVEGVVGGRAATMEQGAVCELPLLGSELRLEISDSAQALCDLPLGTALRARGYIYKRHMEVSHPLNVEVLPRD